MLFNRTLFSTFVTQLSVSLSFEHKKYITIVLCEIAKNADDTAIITYDENLYNSITDLQTLTKY